MKIILKYLIVFIISFFLIEIFAPILVKLGYISRGLPSWVTLFADKDTSFWHPKDVTFEIEKPSCWVSKVSYNNIGMRSTKDILRKNKPRIALLGDSMIENIELDDGKDLGSKVQKLLPNYEVLNFSARATGLADQLDIYKKYIHNEEVDILFLFVTENDFANNYYLHSKINMVKIFGVLK